MKHKVLLLSLLSLTSLAACSTGLGQEISGEEATALAGQMAKRAENLIQTGGVVNGSKKTVYYKDGVSPRTMLSYTYTLSVNKNHDYKLTKRGEQFYEAYDANNNFISKMVDIYLDYTLVHNVSNYDAVAFVKYYDHINDKYVTFSYAGLDNIPSDDGYNRFCTDGDPEYGEIYNLFYYADIEQAVSEYKGRTFYDGTESYHFYSSKGVNLTINADYINPHIGDENYGAGSTSFLAEEHFQIRYENNRFKSISDEAITTNPPAQSQKRKEVHTSKKTVQYTSVGNISLPSNWRDYLIVTE